ncbi:DUF4432 family protein [Marinibacterium sp. SX1]|uniref:DUF4432 family protein n=1 Tax=Marinibacterium sp. SX1 TaxID=3388424 RepID=UPI003D1786CB
MMCRIPLANALFDGRETTVFETPDWQVVSFRYRTGIAGLRISGRHSESVVLPFRGQQIWDLRLGGESVGMRGMTDEPQNSATLADSFGAFFFHCGLMGTGAPGPGDDYPQHGELPLAAMTEAWLEFGDTTGRALTLRSRYRHASLYKTHYLAEPYIRFSPDEAQIAIGIRVENHSGNPMPFQYMGHPNFRPVDGARLAYSAQYSGTSVRLHTAMPDEDTSDPGRLALLQKLTLSPCDHHDMPAGQRFDPEVVFEIDYLSDADGWAHSLQLHPDGTSDAVSHQTQTCPRALRWISRTADIDAIALVEPATSWLGGFSAEKAAGRVPILAPGGVWQTEMRIERLDRVQTTERLAEIDDIAGRTSPKNREL